MNIKFKDVLLYPKKVFVRLTDKKFTLFLGIPVIGCIDLMFPYLLEGYREWFVNRPAEILAMNVLITLALIALLGVLDVTFFTLPLFDFFKFFRKEGAVEESGNQLVRLMKVYIVSHFIFIPINFAGFYIFRQTEFTNPTLLTILAYTYVLVVPIWFSAVISRGINVIYSFERFFRRMVLIAVFSWSYLLSFALEYIINHWLLKLYR